MPKEKSYSDLLRDPRWQKKRLEVLSAAGFKCEDCGSSDKELQVHHCLYKKGFQPWEYENHWFMSLCNDCHLWRQKVEKSIHETMAYIARYRTGGELDSFFWE